MSHDRRERPNDLYITIVQSESDPEVLSIRVWSTSKRRLSASALKRGLLDAGFCPGDTARITFVGLSAEMVEEET